MLWVLRREPCALHPSPFTLHPSPFTLHPSPFTLHSQFRPQHPTSNLNTNTPTTQTQKQDPNPMKHLTALRCDPPAQRAALPIRARCNARGKHRSTRTRS
eukprot:3061510-Rhodomonas_salina.1